MKKNIILCFIALITIGVFEARAVPGILHQASCQQRWEGISEDTGLSCSQVFAARHVEAYKKSLPNEREAAFKTLASCLNSKNPAYVKAAKQAWGTGGSDCIFKKVPQH